MHGSVSANWEYLNPHRCSWPHMHKQLMLRLIQLDLDLDYYYHNNNIIRHAGARRHVSPPEVIVTSMLHTCMMQQHAAQQFCCMQVLVHVFPDTQVQVSYQVSIMQQHAA